MNAVGRLQVAMNKIYKNSLYYQTLCLSPASERLQPLRASDSYGPDFTLLIIVTDAN